MDEPRDPPSNPRRVSAVEHVVAELLDGVMEYRYAPGQRLVEADLTRQFNVSRGTVREAFRRLAADGLIEIVPNRGAVVRRLSQRDLAELFEIRCELEGLAARRAAGNIGDPACRAAFESATAMIWDDAPRLRITDYLDENARFHEAVLKASGNHQLGVVSRQFQLPVIMTQVSALLTPRTLERSLAEHRAIARAILAGDGEEAERMIRAHLQRAARLSKADAAPGQD